MMIIRSKDSPHGLRSDDNEEYEQVAQDPHSQHQAAQRQAGVGQVGR